MNATMFTEKRGFQIQKLYDIVKSCKKNKKQKKTDATSQQNKEKCRLKKKKKRLVVTKGEQVRVEGYRMTWVNCMIYRN